MTKRRKRWLIWGSLASLPLVAIVAFVCIGVFNVFHAHEHCIVGTGLALKTYALDHHGNYPSDTNGFGNALLLLVTGGYLGETNGTYGVALITGPGDNGSAYRDALKTGARVPEEKCSRVYIQGLSENSNPSLAIFFDKKSCPGGDHGRSPWGPLLREVWLVDGPMQIVHDQDWPAFSSNQIELLVKEGFARATAQHYYQIP